MDILKTTHLSTHFYVFMRFMTFSDMASNNTQGPNERQHDWYDDEVDDLLHTLRKQGPLACLIKWTIIHPSIRLASPSPSDMPRHAETIL